MECRLRREPGQKETPSTWYSVHLSAHQFISTRSLQLNWLCCEHREDVKYTSSDDATGAGQEAAAHPYTLQHDEWKHKFCCLG